MQTPTSTPHLASLCEAQGAPLKDRYRPREVAALLGVHRASVARWRRDGLLEPVIVGPRKTYYRAEALDRFLAHVDPRAAVAA